MILIYNYNENVGFQKSICYLSKIGRLVVCWQVWRDGHRLEVGILESLLRGRPLVRSPPEHVRDQLDSIRRRVRDDCAHRSRGELRELEVHGSGKSVSIGPVTFVRRSKERTNFENFIDLGVARKKWPEGVQLGHDAPHCPDVDGCRVHRGSEQNFRCPIPPGRNVICVRRSGSDFFGKSEIGDFDDIRSHAKQIFRLHISVKVTVLVHESQALQYLK